ncbi:hypothetical protein GCM10010121_030880 [Streptomyces brasiliensis]|uniref:HTH araC/xylS-type domain-containing protein n=1 Tax=Streptomyces brasiliensis TaxID=1954 RepID=A0A917KKF3_9ACTN|nr:hypothetical protein GCM10010121_030880 [Streptomyces brasiliensis]
MHTVAVLALDQVIPSDVSAPIDTFGWVRLPDDSPAYRVRVCSPAEEVTAAGGAFTLRAPYGLDELAEADTIMLPGTADPAAPLPPGVAEALREAAARGTRIASICVGAFIFAATGLLDGLRATTHWVAAEDLAARYPEITVDPNVLYVDNGQFLTSAGAAAAMDMCLHMVRKDHGSTVAAHAARMCVMPLEREGGQAQFMIHDLPPAPAGGLLEPLLAWLEENCDQDFTLEEIATKAGMSSRTLNRRFREQTGTTPLQWLHRARVRRAQYLLETTGHPVERIAVQAGFGSPTAFRERFRRVVGTSPQAYRRAFRTGGAESVSAPAVGDGPGGQGDGAGDPEHGRPGAHLLGQRVGPGEGGEVGRAQRPRGRTAGALPPLLSGGSARDGQNGPAERPLPGPPGNAVPTDEPTRGDHRTGNLGHVCLLCLTSEAKPGSLAAPNMSRGLSTSSGGATPTTARWDVNSVLTVVADLLGDDLTHPIPARLPQRCALSFGTAEPAPMP